MPVITGNPTVDAIIVTLCAIGAFLGGLMFKFIKEMMNGNGKVDPQPAGFGRRADDLGTLDKRVALVEQEQTFVKERHEELRGEVRQNRTEQREANTLLFEKLDDITAIVRKD